MPEGIERRRFERFNLKVTINADDQLQAESRNISLGGMCIVSSSIFAVNKMIKLSFPLSGGKIFSVFGKSVRSSNIEDGRFEYGFEFWNMDTDQTRELQRFLSEEISGSENPINAQSTA